MPGSATGATSARGGARGRRPTAAFVYASLLLVYALTLLGLRPSARAMQHSPYNHYALQADAWLHGRLDLAGVPPPYTGRNDFAKFDGRWYVSFPPVPAAMLVPAVAVCGAPERVPDVALFTALAPLGPTCLFLMLEALRRDGRSRRTPRQNAGLALLGGVGTVYWFTAVQGSVWYAGHVVTMAFGGLYLWASVGARRPLLAGLALALAVGTRPTMAFALPFFIYELWRRGSRVRRDALLFSLPLALVGALLAGHNAARFGDPLMFGHRYLEVVWRERIDRYGLFDLRYLGRNLRVVLSGFPVRHEGAYRIGGHGLALWLTSPFLLWAALPPRSKPARATWRALALTALAVATPSLLYQNTGWVQFGYRFSNDYALLLIAMLAVSRTRFSTAWMAACAFAISVNALGAVTFDHPRYRGLYHVTRAQNTLSE